MDAYEKLLKTMRAEAKQGIDLPSYGLAVMTSDTTLTYNGLELEEDDIIIPDHLTTKTVKKVDFTIEDNAPSPNEGYHRHPWTDKSEYTDEIGEGDIVFGFMIEQDDEQKFLIVCRIGGE